MRRVVDDRVVAQMVVDVPLVSVDQQASDHLSLWGRYAHLRDDGNLKLAMSVDRYYQPDEIMPRDWVQLAQRASYDPGAQLASLGRFVEALPNLAVGVASRGREEGLAPVVIDALVDGIAHRCARLRAHYTPTCAVAASPDKPGP